MYVKMKILGEEFKYAFVSMHIEINTFWRRQLVAMVAGVVGACRKRVGECSACWEEKRELMPAAAC